jgi:GrpB-like predicted nucleotidyltransferase (UPF0157 family)
MNNNVGKSKNSPVTEAQLFAVTIGKPDLLNRAIDLQPYDPEWPFMFSILEKQIRDDLGTKALMIEHVGSTSVPGLIAKPVIDIVLAVADSTDERSYVPPLERAGYALRVREPYWFEHRMLKCPSIDGNLHVFSRGCEEIDRMLAFRDWLRTNDDDRKLYQRTKQQLASRTWKYVQNYADAKADVVRDILERALAAR